MNEKNKKINIMCNNMQKYDDIPNDMINSDGKKKYAYVTFIYKNLDIAGAIVLADSLRKLGSLSDLIILITEEITRDGIELLKMFYDDIIKIKDITEDNFDLIKIHALNLIQYKKILLINFNSIILKYPDHLFTLNTPAAVYLPDMDDIIKYDNEDEKIRKIRWFKKYCDCCSHNKLIPKSKTNKKKSLSSELVLLEPSVSEYNIILKDLRDNKNTFMDYLTNRYLGLWLSIEPIFLGNNGFPHWSVLYGIHFINNIPYVLENEISIEERTKYEHFQLWYKFYSNIINMYPELLESQILKDANQISKYFVVPLSRKIIEFKKILAEGLEMSVSKIFNIKKPQNYYYYHINISKEYDNDEINFLFEDDFIPNMISGILKKTTSNYWSDILKHINNISQSTDNTISNKINLKILNKFKTEDRENILSYYAKINSNVSIIIIITTIQNEENFWLDNNLIQNILYQKDISMNGLTLKNILFNINQKYSYDERVKNLNNHYNNTTEYKVKVLLYKTIIDCNLKGNNKDIYVFSDTNSKVRTLSILLNDNTLDKFINNQILFIPEKKSKLHTTFLENEIYIKNMLMYQSLKKWIYNNYDGNEMDNIIVVTNLKFSDEQLMKNFLILDTNIYSDSDNILYSHYEKRKLSFINIIFINKILKNDKKYIKYENIINHIHDLRYYYQIDGIKFML
jgi:hypothetical protein